MDKKELVKICEKKGAVILALCAYFIASIAVNSACMVPYFEPEQPKELEQLKKH